MSEKNTGGPAFPTENWEKMVPQTTGYSEGMTLRDYFAAKAMQGLLAADTDCDWDPKALAIISYEQADAMLKARAA